MKKFSIQLMLLFFCIHMHMYAQVTIGSGKTPESFSALEVVSTTGGVRYPQVNEAKRDQIGTTATEARGLVLFNTSNKGCLEYYAESKGWTNLCGTAGSRSLKRKLKIERLKGSNLVKNQEQSITLKLTAENPISNFRCGKYRDINNVIAEVQSLNQGSSSKSEYLVKLELSTDQIQLLNADSSRQADITMYAIFSDEQGIDKRVEFALQINNGIVNIVII